MKLHPPQYRAPISWPAGSEPIEVVVFADLRKCEEYGMNFSGHKEKARGSCYIGVKDGERLSLSLRFPAALKNLAVVDFVVDGVFRRQMMSEPEVRIHSVWGGRGKTDVYWSPLLVARGQTDDFDPSHPIETWDNSHPSLGSVMVKVFAPDFNNTTCPLFPSSFLSDYPPQRPGLKANFDPQFHYTLRPTHIIKLERSGELSDKGVDLAIKSVSSRRPGNVPIACFRFYYRDPSALDHMKLPWIQLHRRDVPQAEGVSDDARANRREMIEPSAPRSVTVDSYRPTYREGASNRGQTSEPRSKSTAKSDVTSVSVTGLGKGDIGGGSGDFHRVRTNEYATSLPRPKSWSVAGPTKSITSAIPAKRRFAPSLGHPFKSLPIRHATDIRRKDHGAGTLSILEPLSIENTPERTSNNRVERDRHHPSAPIQAKRTTNKILSPEPSVLTADRGLGTPLSNAGSASEIARYSEVSTFATCFNATGNSPSLSRQPAASRVASAAAHSPTLSSSTNILNRNADSTTNTRGNSTRELRVAGKRRLFAEMNAVVEKLKQDRLEKERYEQERMEREEEANLDDEIRKLQRIKVELQRATVENPTDPRQA